MRRWILETEVRGMAIRQERSSREFERIRQYVYDVLDELFLVFAAGLDRRALFRLLCGGGHSEPCAECRGTKGSHCELSLQPSATLLQCSKLPVLGRAAVESRDIMPFVINIKATVGEANVRRGSQLCGRQLDSRQPL